jgi:hypothetical protein
MVSGNVMWPSSNNRIWEFAWSLTHDPEGIVIYGARYRGHLVLYKASLPSLRVQHDNNGCGPWKDPLMDYNAQGYWPCYTSKVCLYNYFDAGQPSLRVQAFHRIGQYKLLERWTFLRNGWIYPRLYSSGLQCNLDHRHHVYWRFDFDINGSTQDLVLEYNTNTPNIGYGPGWHKRGIETSRRKNPTFRRSWAIADKTSWRGYHLLPGRHDGVADSFSNRDLWIMLYHYNEDSRGNQGDAWDDGLSQYLNGENIDGQDVVLWYAGHLAHHSAEGSDEWHEAGPALAPFRNWW